MRDKISIQTPSISQNSTTGEVVQSWSTFIDTRWANASLSAGVEFFSDDQRHTKIDGTFTIKYSSGITPVMRVAYPLSSPKYFDITGIENVENRNKELVITGECIE